MRYLILKGGVCGSLWSFPTLAKWKMNSKWWLPSTQGEPCCHLGTLEWWSLLKQTPVPDHHFYYFFIFLMFIYFWERETEHKQGRGRETGRHRIQSRLQALSCLHRAPCGARTHELWDHDLSQSLTLNDWVTRAPHLITIFKQCDLSWVMRV